MVTHTLETEEEQIVSEGKNLIKASLFNLIVLADSLKGALHCQELVKLITGKFPCRVLFVQIDEAAQGDLFKTENRVEAVGTGSNRVCFDQTTISASMSQLHKVPFIILPNITPDLPVYILMGSDPTLDRVVLPQLQKYATRVVFENDTIDNVQQFSGRMLASLKESSSDFVDMIWAKTKAWREVMARVFNDAAKLDLLNQSKHIQISCCSRAGQSDIKTEMQAIYLQAWLAAQLGWNLLSLEKEDGYLRLSYRMNETPISVSIAPKDVEGLEAGAIYSVEVLTHNDAHFLLSHDGPSKYVTVHASNQERCEMPYTLFLSNYQKGTALINEILYQPPSEHYCSMLTSLNQAPWSTCPV